MAAFVDGFASTGFGVTAFRMFFFAALAFAAALAFGLLVDQQAAWRSFYAVLSSIITANMWTNDRLG